MIELLKGFPVSTEKPKLGRSGDEVRQGSRVSWWLRCGERGERPAHLGLGTIGFRCCCNSERRLARPGADVRRPRRSSGRYIPAGLSR